MGEGCRPGRIWNMLIRRHWSVHWREEVIIDMVKFFNNQDEQGVERGSSVVGSATNAVKKTAKSVVSQFDIVNYLYGTTGSQKGQDQSEDPGTEMTGQFRGNADAALKAGTNVRNPAAAQAAMQRRQQLLKSRTPEKVDELERLRKLLHEEQMRDILQPREEGSEERAAEKQVREEEEKKSKKQEKKFVEEKKKQDLAVVQKHTSIENKGWGAG